MANWEKMASLRKLFNVERTFFQSTSPESTEYDSEGRASRSCSPCLVLPRGSPETNIPRLPQMQNQIFYGIERQFESLHDQFCCRQSPSLQNNRFKNSEPKPSVYSNRRHVDVVEAGFPAHHARVPTPISPASMYNEEIADRNIQGQRPHKSGTKYANVISAVYQEDVADRNILLGGGNTRTYEIGTNRTAPHFNLNNSRSASSLSYYQESWPRLWSRTQAVGGQTASEESRAELRVISSDQDLRSHPPYKTEDVGTSPPRRIGVRQYIALRLKSSSPTLSSKGPENSPPKPTPQPQLKVYKVTPDRPPTARGAGKAPKLNQNSVNPQKQEELKPGIYLAKNATPKLLTGDDASNQLLSPASANLSTRKNVRDLSINTKLAAPTKNFVKVPSQLPDMTVTTTRREPNASIAEIVNSPLPVATPSVVSPRTPSYNVEEIMSMFKHAYISSQTTSSHPTFETLQDAIVREINSHEAFRQVASEIETMPFPETSPAPVPIKPSEESRGHMRKKSSTKSLSGKDKQALRLVNRTFSAKKRRNSYTSGKELSFPAIKGLEAGTELDSGPQERRRRHTYSQPLPPNVQVAPELPRELREEARRANLASSGNTPQPKYTYKLIPDLRPKSSHSVRSKGPPSRPGTAGSSKQPQSRRPALVSQNSQSEMARNVSNRSTPSEKMEPESSKCQPDRSRSGEENALLDVANSSSTPSEPTNGTSNLPQQATQQMLSKRLFSASVQPLGRNRIPLRRSSLHKDLFDSGRFNR
ncbi:hypothetical protein AJ78_00554 [Emergomyces pasteurianus Ep9510]|uniref:Uncharacterized protein n=1 Tax=Emergomyces pasteurianus Ep9510 TaxID=1447872 RepID=A0A1J9PT88_9EURO|nr:hypothetical protein AJ78_00554 [Emergomyces pasteurianus Ep9510]